MPRITRKTPVRVKPRITREKYAELVVRVRTAESKQHEAESKLKAAEEELKKEKRTLEEFLIDCHHIFQNHRLADRIYLAKGIATSVVGKLYPMRLRPWDEFTNTKRDISYNKIAKTLGDKRVFPNKYQTRSHTDLANNSPSTCEQGVINFSNIALFRSVERIFYTLIEVKPDIKQEFEFSKLEFSNTDKEHMEEKAKNHKKLKAETGEELEAKNDNELKTETDEELKIKNDKELKAETDEELEANYDKQLKAETGEELEAKYDKQLKAETGEELEAKYDKQLKAETGEELEAKYDKQLKAETGEELKAKGEDLPQTKEDGVGIVEDLEGRSARAFVYEIKAAHKFRVESIEKALAKENLFNEVVRQIQSNKVPNDRDLKARQTEDMQVAMALTQTFDYMVMKRVAYGFAAAGKSLVLLHIEWGDPWTLYYYNCAVDEERINNQTVGACHTAVAQLASFCLLALRSRTPKNLALENATKASLVQKKWPEPYSEAGLKASPPSSEATSSLSAPEQDSEFEPSDSDDTGNVTRRQTRACKSSAAVQKCDEDEDSDPPGPPARRPRKAGGGKRNEGPSSGSYEGDGDDEMSSGIDSVPTRQYCTQACLLGLKRGQHLDQRCPNVSSHRTVEGCRHPINASELVSLVGKRLRQNPYRGCVAVDPHDLEGKIGSIGTLFKIELAPYGYTFVGKGTQSADLHCLQHESLIYSRLEGLQGNVVPVYLGIVNLARRSYLMPSEARVRHMMLMSWCGEAAASAVLDLEKELSRSSREVRSVGISYGDERTPNIRWNEERGRVMFIDFYRATILPAAKPKQLSILSKNSKNIKIRRRQAGDVFEHKRSALQNELRAEE